jgi:hypothetical protein
VPGGERFQPFDLLSPRLEIAAALDALERDYRALPAQGGRISPIFAELIRQQRDWERGIPPSRAYAGRGAQNPWLLLAFERIASVDASRNASS